MVEKSVSRQHQILEQLLENKAGLTIEHLANRLEISRAAVQQHFTALERDGLIKKKQTNKTGGRPVSLYVLTEQGVNYFPKQYAWLTDLILSSLTEEIAADRLAAYLQKLGNRIADKLQARFKDKNSEERIDEMVVVMNELGFKVNAGVENPTGERYLQAYNCVYHDLAQKHQVICEFDLTLMSSSLNMNITHASCMARGDCACKFVLADKPVSDSPATLEDGRSPR